MKSYIDLGQSKQLMEFLPIESADMHFVMIDTSTKEYSVGLGNYIGVLPSVPCWSLSALLAQMPWLNLDTSEDNYYRVFWRYMYSDWHDNPVDACVELILREKKEKGK